MISPLRPPPLGFTRIHWSLDLLSVLPWRRAFVSICFTCEDQIQGHFLRNIFGPLSETEHLRTAKTCGTNPQPAHPRRQHSFFRLFTGSTFNSPWPTAGLALAKMASTAHKVGTRAFRLRARSTPALRSHGDAARSTRHSLRSPHAAPRTSHLEPSTLNLEPSTPH